MFGVDAGIILSCVLGVARKIKVDAGMVRVGREHCSHVREHLFAFAVRKYFSELNHFQTSLKKVEVFGFDLMQVDFFHWYAP